MRKIRTDFTSIEHAGRNILLEYRGSAQRRVSTSAPDEWRDRRGHDVGAARNDEHEKETIRAKKEAEAEKERKIKERTKESEQRAKETAKMAKEEVNEARTTKVFVPHKPAASSVQAYSARDTGELKDMHARWSRDHANPKSDPITSDKLLAVHHVLKKRGENVTLPQHKNLGMHMNKMSEETNSEARMKIKNVARPDGAPPTSKESKLAKQGEIKTKIMEETQLDENKIFITHDEHGNEVHHKSLDKAKAHANKIEVMTNRNRHVTVISKDKNEHGAHKVLSYHYPDWNYVTSGNRSHWNSERAAPNDIHHLRENNNIPPVLKHDFGLPKSLIAATRSILEGKSEVIIDPTLNRGKEDVDTKDFKKKKKMTSCDEETVDEGVQIKKEGQSRVIQDGNTQSFVLHPEHMKKVTALANGEKTKFKDDTNRHVEAHHDSGHIHFKFATPGVSNKTTTVKREHLVSEAALPINDPSRNRDMPARQVNVRDYGFHPSFSVEKNKKAVDAARRALGARGGKVIGIPDDMAHHFKEDADIFSERELEEMLKKTDPAGKWISDFVHSKDPKFEGKTKKERMKMALGAYYGNK